MKTIISKGEFAQRMNRSPACVTKWIKGGKISADALIDGRAAPADDDEYVLSTKMMGKCDADH